MKSITTFLIALLLVSNGYSQDTNDLKIKFLNLKNCDIPTAASALSLSTNLKIVCTEKTAVKNVSLLIRDISAINALKLICRSTNLVYRYDENSDFYTLMTLEEYRENAVIEGREETKIFKVEPANLDLIADTIEALYEKQVVLTQNDLITDFSESNSNNSSNSSSSSNSSRNQNNSDSSTNNNRKSNGNSGNNANSRVSEEAVTKTISSEDALALEDASMKKNGSIFDVFPSTFGGPRIFVTTNREHNMIIIKSSDIPALDEIEKLIENIDQPMPQVILEMKILSLSVGEDERIGFDYSLNDGSPYMSPTEFDDSGQPTSFDFLGYRDNLSVGQDVFEAGNTFAYRYINESLRARIQMKAQLNQVDMIATPILIAANNREAKIEVGKERIITTGVSVETITSAENGQVGEARTIIYETEVKTIGTTLTIIPRINKNRTVTLYVEQENSTLIPNGNTLITDGQTIDVDAIDTARIQATVVAKDGFTIAIGGLIQSNRSEVLSKVPLLGDVPMLGKLFSKNEERVEKSELILLIRPFIIDGSLAADSATKEIINRLSNHHYHNEGDDAIDSDNAQLQKYLDNSLKTKTPSDLSTRQTAPIPSNVIN